MSIDLAKPSVRGEVAAQRPSSGVPLMTNTCELDEIFLKTIDTAARADTAASEARLVSCGRLQPAFLCF